MEIVYFDQAATSWPKPPAVLAAMNDFQNAAGANPGRSGHRLSLDAGRTVLAARQAVAELFSAADPLSIVFMANATMALNLAILGLLEPGDHCITTGMEHNSVMRPLRSLQARGLDLSIVACSPAGELDPADIIPLIKPTTRAIFMMHASNVTGTIMPVAEIGRIAQDHGLILGVDAAQTAGAIPIDVAAMQIDILAFTGHKSLYGPQGTGGLYIRPGLEQRIRPIITGGTGSRSEFEVQPDFMPDKFEAGTPNAIGLAGLQAGVRFILDTGIHAIRVHEQALTDRFLNGLGRLPGTVVYGPAMSDKRIAVIAFNLAGPSPSEVAQYLDDDYGILSRPGLHCAPSAHKTIGTFPLGTNRFSFGYFNTVAEIDRALEALGHLNGGGHGRNH